MDDHVKTLGWMYIIFGALGLVVAFFVALIVGGAGILSGDAQAAAITSGVGLLVGVFVALMSAPSILAGWGLLNRRPWARILTIVLAVLSLPGIPIGTLLGIYSLWVLMNERTVELFRTPVSY
ncbi:MAG: hypothetical protein JWM27_3389 [Gemmatimonadetes bacterium]|nr:hypothetical protein [Gemmatimonadota bacterium]